MTTCQITYLPLGAQDAYDDVARSTDIISRFDLDMEVHPMSTTIKGDLEEILDMVNTLYQEMDDEEKLFRLHVELLSSNDYS